MTKAGMMGYSTAFVTQTVEMSRNIAELRAVRDELVVRRQLLSLKKLEVSMQHGDLREINKEITIVMIEWRRVSDRIDELLETQLGYVNMCKVGR